MANSLAALEKSIGYVFRQPSLLKLALTHRSYAAQHNERLEFLGDSLLNCVVASLLYQHFTSQPEGTLSRLRSTLVCQDTLHDIAARLDLGSFLLLGEGEIKSGGRQRPSILADALESVFGAIFQDSGFDSCHQVISQLFQPLIVGIDPLNAGKDAKTLLQEYLQGRRLPLPEYHLASTSGQAHAQVFHIDCLIPSLAIKSHGTGNSRRAAEQAAARMAWQLIEQEARRA